MQNSNYMVTFLSALTITVSLCSFVTIKTQAPGQLSEEERTMLDLIANLSESELEQLAHTIEDEVGKMTPEEQSAFWSEVDKEAQRLQPKIENYIKEQDIAPTEKIIAEPSQPKKPTKKTRPITPKEEPENIEKKHEIKSKTVSTEELLLNIIKVINNYLATAQSIPDFSDELEEWAENDKLKPWRSDLSWSFFKSQIESLVQKLNKLIERDENNAFKYLEYVIKEESLYNNLSQLERNLNKYARQLDEITLEMETLSPQSEQAMQGLTSSLYEALNMLHIVGALDTVMVKYKPTEEQLKQEEKEQIERARQEESIKIPQRPIVSAGIPETDTGFSTTPSYQSASSSIPTYSRKTNGTVIPSTSRLQQQSGEPMPVSGGKPIASTPPAKKSGDKPESKKQFSGLQEKDDKIADDYLKDLTKGLDSGMVAIEDAQLGSIKNQMLNNRRPYNQLTAEVYLPESISKIRKAADAARTLELRIKRHLKGSVKTKYQTLLQKAIQPHKNALVKIADQIQTIRTNEDKISDDKAYAYLGGLRKDRISQEIQQRIPRPSSLYTLENYIRELLKTID